ncbi:quinone oxidoreductase family protein [Streptomyces sp. NRRL WC-3742]|uniref:quinone oxidoreductase family protein n=1 Tax=Streptomyces sp. NRRL WC-3742 TaxID=1463934 RepID=UPI0004CC3C15|nr:zinc-binding dehydrogenase [Streptomyces sp. NRRL WC-3742]
MRAIRFDTYGGPEVLTLVDTAVPEPGPGEVSIDVTYAGVNFAEVMFRRGQFEPGTPHVPGLEVTGTVRALGEGVTTLRPGQRVAALTLAGGGYAEVAVARERLTVALDGELDAIPAPVAAAFPCNLPVSWAILHEVARVREGESVLVLAGAGGVGSGAAQIARHLGAGRVFGAVGSAAKLGPATRFGYDEVLTYEELERRIPELTDGQGVDVLLDSVGGPVRARALDLLAPLGRHVVYGNASQQDHTYEANLMWYTAKTVAGYNIGGLANRRPDLVHGHLVECARLLASGAVRIETTELALEDVAKAHEILERRDSTGKFVLRVS